MFITVRIIRGQQEGNYSLLAAQKNNWTRIGRNIGNKYQRLNNDGIIMYKFFNEFPADDKVLQKVRKFSNSL